MIVSIISDCPFNIFMKVLRKHTKKDQQIGSMSEDKVKSNGSHSDGDLFCERQKGGGEEVM